MIGALVAIAFDAATMKAVVEPKFLNGTHMACEAAFDVVVEDTAYHAGRPVAVAGSFTFYNWPDGSRLFVGMKMGVSEDGATYVGPQTAYVLNGYKTNLADLQSSLDSDAPGFRLFVFDVEGDQTLNALWGIASRQRLDVAYTLGDGSMPMTFPVEFSEDAANAWNDCIMALIERDDPQAD